MRYILLFLPACLLLDGCGFLFLQGPPEGHEKLVYFDCDTSAAAPTADGTWALVDAIFLAAFASANGDSNSGSHVGAAPVGIAAVLGVVHLASTVYGVVKISHCSEAREHLRQRITASAVQRQRIIDELQRRLDAASALPPLPAPPAAAAEPSVPPEPPQSTGSTSAPSVPAGNSEIQNPVPK